MTESRFARLQRPSLGIVLAVVAGAAAHAQVGSNTVAITVANTQTGQSVASDGRTAGPGVDNTAQALAPGDFTTNSVVTAEFQRGTGPNSAPALMTVAHSSNLASDNHQGVVTLAALASMTATDRLTISGAPMDNRAVTFHTTLRLFEGIPGVPGFQTFSDEDDLEFRVESNATLRISSEGIGQSELGSDVFGIRAFTVEDDRESTRTFLESGLIDFDLTFNLGEARLFSITMLDEILMSIDDHRGNLSGRALGQSGWGLAWTGSIRISDAATGLDMCGLSLLSEAGIDYGSVAACPGDGGSTVPEPSAWALMIAGFVAAGGALRRRRFAA